MFPWKGMTSEAWNSGFPNPPTNVWKPLRSSDPKCMSAKLEIHRDFRECIELLLCHGVDFVVIGGYAVAAHGRPRYTGDIDFYLLSNKRATGRSKDLIDLGLLGDPG